MKNEAIISQVQTKDEIALAARLADAIWHECYAGLLEPAQIDYMVDTLQSASAIQKQMEADGYLYYIVTVDDAPAGYLAVQPKDGKLLLSKIYLEAAFRGRGLRPQIFTFFEDLARAQNCSLLWLTVNRHNARAIAAYQKAGFTITREQVSDIGQGYVMDDYIFEKSI